MWIVGKLYCSLSSYFRLQSSSKPSLEIVRGNSNLGRDLLKNELIYPLIPYLLLYESHCLLYVTLNLILKNSTWCSSCGYVFYARLRSQFELRLKRFVLHNRGGKCLLRGSH